MRKKAITPVVATILLIAITIVIALIVFLWFQGITEEAITKFDGTNVKIICDQINFDSSYTKSSQTIFLSNRGNVPIYRLKAKISGGGSYRTEIIGSQDTDSWPRVGLNQGDVYSGILNTTPLDTEILVIPVLIGITESGVEKAYTCEELYANQIII